MQAIQNCNIAAWMPLTCYFCSQQGCCTRFCH